MNEKPYVITVPITIHHTEPIPNATGRLGYSNDYPGKQFLIMPTEQL